NETTRFMSQLGRKNRNRWPFAQRTMLPRRVAQGLDEVRASGVRVGGSSLREARPRRWIRCNAATKGVGVKHTAWVGTTVKSTESERPGKFSENKRTEGPLLKPGSSREVGISATA